MEDNVFYSKIKRRQEKVINNLYELINVQPAKPAVRGEHQDELVCNFQPDCSKLYVPKKRSNKTIHVKTVRDLRKEFEEDTFIDLPKDLERQQNLLLKKITEGSTNDQNTKKFAIHLLGSGNPLNRETWQMLTNINPQGHIHGIQYVLWNGKCIRVTGSKGGKLKFLHNRDLAIKNYVHRKIVSSANKRLLKNNGLLRNSLAIKFKPGPLSRKRTLDDSFQKYNVGTTDLVKLPKIGLSVSPKPGVIFPPAVTNILQNFRNLDGKISEKWAEFAVSILQTTNNSNSSLNKLENSVTFNLNYKTSQRVLLMRHVDIVKKHYSHHKKVKYDEENDPVIESDVGSVLNRILDAVEISLSQDNFYSGIDDPREVSPEDIVNTKRNSIGKERTKRNAELDRLDVTIIRIPQNQDNNNDPCQKSFCSLGCICSSLQSSYHIKYHCGRIECMFECKCDFSNYKFSDSFDNDCPEILQGLISMDSVMNSHLAKEEQKFHQTVVLTGEKSIVLKSQKRNSKATKRYAEYFEESKPLKLGMTKHMVLSLNKLNCSNIEPWCMVHNLYKCFCKGQFIREQLQGSDQNNCFWGKEVLEEDTPTKSDANEDYNSDTDKSFSTSNITFSKICARTQPFTGQKFKPSFYSEINKKIRNLEANDSQLQKRISMIMNNQPSTKKKRSNNYSESMSFTDENNDSNLTDINVSDYSPSKDESVKHKLNPKVLYHDLTDNLMSVNKTLEKPKLMQDRANDFLDSKQSPNKSVLTSWLETSYRNYKQRFDKGVHKIVLDPPKQGKMALYPWEFILSRYKERKNLFLISKQMPYRIFMAVDLKNDFFKNCMNIDDIRLADLNKYPITVKNLLINATDLKDNFCILFGLQICWELVGSVTKVGEKSEFDSEKFSMEDKFKTTEEDDDLESNESISLKLCETNKEDTDTASEAPAEESSKSKWFIMTVENDFSEIQFYNRGFFVKHESLIKSINVARATGNTIRLSSHKAAEHQYSPQFGLYAVPNTNERCVFVGPYDKDEPLGIEVVKSLHHVRKQNRTRGFWITTSTIDNFKVIDNPLSFMPPNQCHSKEVVHLEESSVKELNEEDTIKTPKTPNVKLPSSAIPTIKPKYVFVKAVSNKTNKNKLVSLLKVHPGVVPQTIQQVVGKKILLQSSVCVQSTDNKKPVAEIAPQIKNTNESECVKKEMAANRPKERGMFILKPEEINQRLMQAASLNDMKPTVDVTMNQKPKEIDESLTQSSSLLQSTVEVEVNQKPKETDQSLTQSSSLLPSTMEVEVNQKPKETDQSLTQSSSLLQSTMEVEVNQKPKETDQSYIQSTIDVLKPQEIDQYLTPNGSPLQPTLDVEIDQNLQETNQSLIQSSSLLQSTLEVNQKTKEIDEHLTQSSSSLQLSLGVGTDQNLQEINQSLIQSSSTIQSTLNVEKNQKTIKIHQHLTQSSSSLQSKVAVKLNQEPQEIEQSLTKFSSLQPSTLDAGIHEEPKEVDQTLTQASSSLQATLDVEMKQDIENFLATSEVCTLPDVDNIYIISDDEEDKPQFKQVYIECVNIQNMGWIKGRKNKYNMISFAFPGFKYTNFYVVEMAFSKINMVLSRKIFVPKQLKVGWRVVDSMKDLKYNFNELNLDSFGKDYILTKLGPKHKSRLTVVKSLK